jgi:hypothetical protein
MKNTFIVTILLCCFYLSAISQVQHFYVHPSATDAAYTTQDSHLVARNISTQNNKLFLFIGGTFSTAQQYEFFSLYAAGLGFHVLNISYPNSVLTTLLASNSDSLIFNKFREEICFGTQISPSVNVDSLNSIYTRTLKLLVYLNQTYPQDGWGQYLLSQSSIDWSKVAVSGHSQGAGHAAYFAKKFLVERAVMFAGPNDYSTYFSNAAPWLRNAGITPTRNHFTFFHLRDQIVPFNHQYENIRGMGMLQQDDTTLVDNLLPPYNNSRCLYSNAAPNTSGQFHNSVVIFPDTPLDTANNPAFDPVWRYMLLSDIATGINEKQNENTFLKIFPNPASTIIYVQLDAKLNDVHKIEIADYTGKIVATEFIYGSNAKIDVSILSPGIYMVKNNNKFSRLVKF